jgi:hypothetical protein
LGAVVNQAFFCRFRTLDLGNLIGVSEIGAPCPGGSAGLGAGRWSDLTAEVPHAGRRARLAAPSKLPPAWWSLPAEERPQSRC